MSLDAEICVIRGFLTSSAEEEWNQSAVSASVAGSLLQSLLEGDFEAVLLSPQVQDLLTGDGSYDDEDIEAYLERRVVLYLSDDSNGDQNSRELVVMALAVSCLHMFAQSNWTGPPLSLNLSNLLPAARLSSQKSLVEEIHSHLLLDGESVYSLVANPLLLLLARVILCKCSIKMESLQEAGKRLVGMVCTQAALAEEVRCCVLTRRTRLIKPCCPGGRFATSTSTSKSWKHVPHSSWILAHSCMEKVFKHQSLLSAQRNLTLQLHLECAYLSLTYYEYQPAKEHIRKAQELSGLSTNMTGALGKRTRFQQKFLAQLILEVTKNQDDPDQTGDETAPTPLAFLPKDYHLDDDTVLDEVSLAEPDRYKLPDLSAEEQALILGICTDFQRNNPVHKLTEEELLAFTSCLLSQPKFWAVEVTALCLRTKLERGRTRCVERAMMQTQAIVDHFEDKSCPTTERLKVFYCCQAPPRWTVQKLLASLLIDLGCTSSALLLYEKLELWEDAVICYERLGQHGRAEEIVRRELEKKETPTLYCLLGDILNDHQYYDRAWELSGRRSARAMRSKALLHLRNKELQRCVECFEQSLKINTMQLGVWFSLGCAYFALEGYEGAARAFQRCVGLEPDNAEAWNNLSTAYIRLQMKNKAFRTLQEALKCNYEHWQIWENFIVVSTDIGDFAEAIKAYHRLMDLRENYKDVQILQILVRAVVENLNDSQGVPAGALRPKLKELLGRVSSRHSSDAEIWQQYALLYGDGCSDSPEDNDK
ncbi:Tetratricopeptide repeat protein 27, partial [Oryzias melastigma]